VRVTQASNRDWQTLFFKGAASSLASGTLVRLRYEARWMLREVVFRGDVLRKENVARKKATLGRTNITNHDVMVEVEVWESP